MKDILTIVGSIIILIVGSAISLASIACAITGFVVTVQASNWLLLIAEAILPPLATFHGLGHLVGFWP